MVAPNTLLQNRYLIEEQIGQGGMGAVFIATDQRFGSKVALKETFFDDPGLRKAFEREARLLNHLRHAALPKVIDHFTQEEGQFLVMEFIAGDDLAEKLRLRGGAFPLSEVLSWADQLLDALDYLHTQDPVIIHRDIKPQNLKLTPRNHIVLLDFGLAKGTPSQLSKVTATGSIFGYSRNYAPLEQIQGAGTDPRSDLYSLGATLYHLMTGSTPPDALTRATSVLNGQPDPLQTADQVHVQVTPGVAAVVNQAMAQNASQRPESAAQMREALRSAALEGHATIRESVVALGAPSNVYEQETQLISGEAAQTAGGYAENKTEPIKGEGAATVVDERKAAGTVAVVPTKVEDSKDEVTKVAASAGGGWMRGRGRAIGIAASAVVLIALAALVYTFTRDASPSQNPTTAEATPTPVIENGTPTPGPTPEIANSADPQPTAPRQVKQPTEPRPETPQTVVVAPTPTPSPRPTATPTDARIPQRPIDPDTQEAIRSAEDRRQAAIEERRTIQERRRIMIQRQMERERRRRPRYP